jgi:protein-disulfide isomerase
MSTRRNDARQRRQAAERARQEEARRRARQRRYVVTAVAVVLLLVAGVAGWYVYQAQRPAPSGGTLPAAADTTGVRVGSGPVTVDIYLDFMCPHCRQFEGDAAATLDKLARDGKATIVYHPVAFLDRASSTKYSTRAAAASACAADTGHFTDYVRALYDNQPSEGSAGLTDQRLIDLAGKAGIATGPFGDCVRAGTHKAWVDGVTEQATKANINATPTVLVNGKSVDPTADAVSAAVERG